MSETLLEVERLRVAFGGAEVVRGVSFDVRRGEVLALVGESGSGKSVCAMSLLGLTRWAGATVTGSARLEGRELVGLPEPQLRRVRGGEAAMVFQDPMSSLNPLMRVGEQIAEQIRAHEPGVGRAHALERAAELMERLEIPDAHARVRSYPHELSGGMRQRVMIAMALSLGPKLLLADEPTTALDVGVQGEILAQLDRLRAEERMGIVLITHDFAVVSQIADRIVVMRAGEVVEQGDAEQVLSEPRHEYTRALLAALVPPARRVHAHAPTAGGSIEPVAQVEGLRVQFRGRDRAAVDGVSLGVRPGETLAIVGESACGKTTLLRAIARLADAREGTVAFAGRDITRAHGRRLAALHAGLGVVFQDPQASLNPRRRVGATLARALWARGMARSQAPEGVVAALERVGLSAEHAARFPHELSGGERQRVSIARALAGQPRLVLLDEPVSSLDAALRRGTIELLAELQEQIGCAYVLVSHDLAIVAGVADRIAVMSEGRIVELGGAEELLEKPTHPYTRALLAARPQLPGAVRSSRWSQPSPETSPQTP